MSKLSLIPVAWVFLALIPGARAGAQDPTVSELLEKGVYEEETVGDLKAAIRIYDRIVQRADADRPHVARALYRLGLCHLKGGDRAQATAAFERLVREYPDQGELVAKARPHLPSAKATDAALIPAPWESGELLRYTVTFNPATGPQGYAGKYLGETAYSVVAAEVDGKPAWRQEQYMGSPKFGIQKYCRVEAERDSFLPLASLLVHTNLGRARTEYAGGERRMYLSRPGEKMPSEPYVQKLHEAVFDNEQNVFIFRRLPLEAGFKTRITIAGRPGSTFIAEIEVAGREVVKVPAGSFDCFRITASVAPTVETHWITADAHRYPVKMVSAEAVMELTGIARIEPGPRTWRSESLGISLPVPAGWNVLPCVGARAPEDGLVQLVSPEMTVWGMLFRRPPEGVADARSYAEKHIAGVEKRIKGYTVRPGSLKEFTLAGLPAASYVADHALRGWSSTEHDTFVVTESGVYVLVFVAARERFEAQRAAIDEIVAGLTIGK